MPLTESKVLQGKRPDKETFRQSLADDWQRAFPHSVRGTAADIMGCNPKTISNAVAGNNVPEAYTVLSALLADKTALQSTLALFGLEVRPLRTEAANDISTLANLSSLSGEWLERIKDGVRCHRDTCAIADLLRPILPALVALVAEADRIKGAA